tara:strand:- start:70 stop:348 length:279 start_codon:yes stop_codon:yes gene_type:complete
MTFEQFQKTREVLTLDHPHHGEVDVYAYNVDLSLMARDFPETTDDVLHIVINEDVRPTLYELTLDRSDFESDDLGQLEKWLYDFSIVEGFVQ